MGGSTQESNKWEYTLNKVILQRNVTLRKNLQNDGEIRQSDRRTREPRRNDQMRRRQMLQQWLRSHPDASSDRRFGRVA